jgi:hypothetical protein
VFQDPYEFLPDLESIEGGNIKFKQVRWVGIALGCWW